MKALAIRRRWHALEALIDARNPRERALLFLVAMAALYAVGHFALFNPLRNHQTALRERVSADQAALAALRAQTTEMLTKTRQDPDLPNRKRLAELTRQLDAVDGPLAEMMKSLVSPKEMNALIKTVLSDHGRLTVVSMVNVPPEPLAAQNAAAAGAKADGAAAPLYKHGLRIEFKGSFRDIVGFFSDLEKLSWRVLWDEAEIKTERYPVSTATVTVYTLSTDQAWISL